MFIFVPFLFASNYSPRTWILASVSALAILVFFLGTTVVMHWREEFRWLWLVGLMSSILLMGLVTDGDSRPNHFAAFVTAVLGPLRAGCRGYRAHHPDRAPGSRR